MNKATPQFIDAIDYAVNQTIDASTFLTLWQEGDWEAIEKEFPDFKISDELRNPPKSNTKVTITYANGSTREFVASDKLEQSINEGEMFSVTTMHSDMSIDEEMAVSKMYIGNPVAAMGNMMIMRHNAEKLINEEGMVFVRDTLTACIGLMSNEITSHQSGMSPVKVEDQSPMKDVKFVEDNNDTYTYTPNGDFEQTEGGGK